MRVHRGARLLALAATTAAITAPSAQAESLVTEGGGPTSPVAAHQRPGSATDWRASVGS
jgi:hypothetical protein